MGIFILKHSNKLALLYVGISVLLFLFCYRLWDIGITHTDDASWFLHTLQGNWRDGKEMAIFQGRVWALVSGPIVNLAMYFHGSIAGEFLRVGSIAIFFILFHTVLSIYFGNTIALMAASMNLAFYAMRWEGSMVTTYPALFGVLASFFLIAILLCWINANNHRPTFLYAALAGLFASLFMHEGLSLLFSLLFIAAILGNHYLLYHELPSSKSLKVNNYTRVQLIGALAVIGSYFLIYFAWRWAFPTGYSGNMVADLNANRIFSTLVALSTSGSVLSDIVVPYHVRFGDPVIEDGYTATYSLLPYLSQRMHGPAAILAGAISFLLVFILGRSVMERPAKYTGSVGWLALSGSFIGFLIAAIPILPVALTQKYQQQYFDLGVRSYVYTGLSHFGISLVIACFLLWVFSLLKLRSVFRTVLSAIIAVLAGLLTYSGYHMNDAIANDIRLETRRWKAVDAALEITSEMNLDQMVLYSPKMSFGSWFTGLPMSYWKDYAYARRGKNVSFVSNALPLENIKYGNALYMDFGIHGNESGLTTIVAPLELLPNQGPVISNQIFVAIESPTPSDISQYVLSFTDVKRGPVSVRYFHLREASKSGAVRTIENIEAIPSTIRVTRGSGLQALQVACENKGVTGTSIAIGFFSYGMEPPCLGDILMTKDEYLATNWSEIERYLGKSTRQSVAGNWEVVDYPFDIFVRTSRQNIKITDPFNFLALPRQMSNQIGKIRQTKRSIWLEAATGEAGALAYGPYIALAKGKYEASFRLAGESSASGELIGNIDVAFRGGRVIASSDLVGLRDWQLLTLPFEVKENEENFEFRVFSNGIAPLKLKEIMVKRLLDK